VLGCGNSVPREVGRGPFPCALFLPRPSSNMPARKGSGGEVGKRRGKNMDEMRGACKICGNKRQGERKRKKERRKKGGEERKKRRRR